MEQARGSMESAKDELGRWGEKFASRFLKRQGYRVLARNVVLPVGELDIVARDGEELVFVEVKTRTSGEFGGPLGAVGPAKRRKIIQAARSYVAQHRLGECPCRFDVVGVTRGEEGKEPEVELVRGAFTLGGRH
jgi:putative endonuclease